MQGPERFMICTCCVSFPRMLQSMLRSLPHILSDHRAVMHNVASVNRFGTFQNHVARSSRSRLGTTRKTESHNVGLASGCADTGLLLIVSSRVRQLSGARARCEPCTQAAYTSRILPSLSCNSTVYVIRSLHTRRGVREVAVLRINSSL